MTTKAKKMKRNAWKEVLLDVMQTIMPVIVIGMLFVTLCIMGIGNRKIADKVREYGIEKAHIPQERTSVKQEMAQYIASLPVPPRVYTSIHEESILELKEETEKMQKILEEAIAKNSTLGMKVVGMTPLIYLMNTTAYCPCEKCCRKTDGITASGAKATQWHTVAAGKEYKLGSIIYIPSLNDKPNGGWFVVQDRGGAISSEKLDIYMDNHSEALQYGRKTQECWIFKK